MKQRHSRILSGTYIELPYLLKARAKELGINFTRFFTNALLYEVALREAEREDLEEGHPQMVSEHTNPA